jgi:fatty acid desaturase
MMKIFYRNITERVVKRELTYTLVSVVTLFTFFGFLYLCINYAAWIFPVIVISSLVFALNRAQQLLHDDFE